VAELEHCATDGIGHGDDANWTHSASDVEWPASVKTQTGEGT
jgi:hypothetical protein